MGLAPAGGLAAPGRLTWAHVDVQTGTSRTSRSRWAALERDHGRAYTPVHLVVEAYERVVVAAAVVSSLAGVGAPYASQACDTLNRWRGILADRLDTLGTVLACELRSMPGAGSPARDVHPAVPALPVGASDGGTYGAGGHCGAAASADHSLVCTRCERSVAELRAEVAREASFPADRRLQYPTAFCNERCPAARLDIVSGAR